MKLKGTKTEANLMAAFAGESQARNKYTFYAEQAKGEGLGDIAEIFEETARNEVAHAKLWFKLLHEDSIPETKENLTDAANGENYEWTDMYEKMAADAKEEGFEKISKLFLSVARIEKYHEKRYLDLLKKLESGSSKDSAAASSAKSWKCENCGYIHEGADAPDVCILCGVSKDGFKPCAI